MDEYNQPSYWNKLELFKSTILQKPSAWSGHFYFATQLVKILNPQVTVDLGVDFGFSLFSLAYQNAGITYGIDWFEGDSQAGFRDTFEYCNDLKNRLTERYPVSEVKIIKGDFEDVAKTWYRPIDILHIDGLHTYEAVKKDYQNWAKHVHQNGVIMFHDVETFVGVATFFDQLDGYKIIRRGSCGLGLLTKSEEIFRKIEKLFFIPDKIWPTNP